MTFLHGSLHIYTERHTGGENKEQSKLSINKSFASYSRQQKQIAVCQGCCVHSHAE